MNHDYYVINNRYGIHYEFGPENVEKFWNELDKIETIYILNKYGMDYLHHSFISEGLIEP